MTTFACVLYQPPAGRPDYGYNADWVRRLRRNIGHHYAGEFRFVVLHDGLCGDSFGAGVIPLRLDPCDVGGWSPMMQVWRPDVSDGRLCVLGLDTVCVGDITEIVDWKCDLGLIRDVYQRDTLSNSVGTFSASMVEWLWEKWDADRSGWAKRALYGDQFSEMVFLRQVGSNMATRLCEKFPGQILSYKAQVNGLGQTDNARIVYFHGWPKQDQISDRWIIKEWYGGKV